MTTEGTGEDRPATAGRFHAARAWVQRYERLLWIAFFAAIVAYRWPLLKGYYYKAAHVAMPSTAIPWRHDLNAALDEARRTHRPVLVDFHASWCPPCLAMAHDVWPDGQVERAVSERFIPVSIDIDQDGGVSDRYKVDSIPTVLVLDGDGRVVRTAGYLPVSGMMRFLDGSWP